MKSIRYKINVLIPTITLAFFSLSCDNHEASHINVSEKKLEVTVSDTIKTSVLQRIFSESYEEIEIIGNYTGLVLNGDSLVSDALISNKSINILKDDLNTGFLVMKNENNHLKTDCSNQTQKYVYNKRGYFIFNEELDQVISVHQSRYNDKVNVIETPFVIYNLSSNCFEIIFEGVFDGENIDGQNVRRAFNLVAD